MHKKIDHVRTVRRAPAIRSELSELAKQRRLRLQQLEDLRMDAAEAHATAAPRNVGRHLLVVGQTVGQPARTVALIGDPPHRSRCHIACVQMQRFCPDTEEVTGSNPVSPTSNTPSEHSFYGPGRAVWRVDQLTCRPNFVGLSLGIDIEKLIDPRLMR
jgi:hypothetical protein